MKLSTRTRYAVRAVFDIAYHGQGKATQARDIARRQEVPVRYLEQILQQLKQAHLVGGKRGPRGGYSLSRAPEEISIGDIIRAMQGPIELQFDDAPLDASTEAPSGNRLVAASIWKELGARVVACFDEVSIRELCRKGESLGLQRGDPQGHMYFI